MGKEKRRGGILPLPHALFLLFMLLFAMSLVVSAAQLIRSAAPIGNPKTPRVVSVYDGSGKPVRQWFGKLDVSYIGERVTFLSGDRRIVINGAAVINEEM